MCQIESICHTEVTKVCNQCVMRCWTDRDDYQRCLDGHRQAYSGALSLEILNLQGRRKLHKISVSLIFNINHTSSRLRTYCCCGWLSCTFSGILHCILCFLELVQKFLIKRKGTQHLSTFGDKIIKINRIYRGTFNLIVVDTYQEVHNKFVKEDNSNTSNSHLEFHISSFHVSKVATRKCSIVCNNLRIINKGYM